MWLLLLACVLTKTDSAASGTSPSPLLLAGITCPAASNAPFPEDLPPSATAPAGAVAGTFAITPTGEATYTIPLLVPPGRAGMQPSLALTYDSSAGNGLLGMGFSISGLSAITRCPQNLAQDGAIREVTYGSGDPLCLDGKRLILVGFDAAASALEYQTFPDTFAKVLAYEPPGWDWDLGPASLRVFTKSGLIVDYGATPSSQVMAKNGVIRAWWVSQTSDRRGNTVAFAYRNDKDPAEGYTIEHAPLRIDYTGHPSAPATRAVTFSYKPRASQDIRTLFSGGMALKSSLALDKIQMVRAPGDTLVREYRLSYDVGPATGRTTLRQVEECAADDVCKPPTRFWWNSAQPGFSAIPTNAKAPESSFASVMLVDVTGDGLDDLAVPDVEQIGGIGEIPITNYLVTPNVGFDPPKPTTTPFFATTKSAFEEEHYGDIPVPVQPELSTPIDYNQDGLTDLFLHDVHGNFPNWTILLATPAHKFQKLDTSLPHPLGLGQISPVHLRDHDVSAHLADVDGDGVADLIQCAHDGITFAWTAHLWTPARPGWSPAGMPIGNLLGYPCDTELHTIDVNSDGKVDLLVRKSHWTSNGPIFEGTYEAVSLAHDSVWSVVDTSLPVTAPGGALLFLDANGDGLPDAIQTGFGDRQLRTFFNTGRGFAEPVLSLGAPLINADQFMSLAAPIDFNGDGRQDLLLPIQAGTNGLPWWILLQANGSMGDGTFTVVDPKIPFEAQIISNAPDGQLTLANPQTPRVTDVDGDGAQDVVLPLNKLFHVFRSSVADQDLLTLVSDGMNPREPADPSFNANVVIRYGHLIDKAMTDALPEGGRARETAFYLSHDDPDNDCTYPRRCVVGPRRAVRGYAINNGQNSLRHFSVRYRDGRFHRLGRGFLGFGERIVLDLGTGAGTAEFYDNVSFDPDLKTFPYAGQVVRSWRYNPGLPSQPAPDRMELSYGLTSLATIPTSGGATYFTLPIAHKERREQGLFPPGGTQDQSVEQYVRDTELIPATILGTTVTEVQDYDLFGNILVEETSTAGEPLTLRVSRTFANDESTWRIGELLLQKECSSALWVTQCRSLVRSYDSTGQVFTEWRGSDDGDRETQLSLIFERDSFGNITHTTALDAFEHRREACTSYDAEGIFPFAQKNPAGHLTLTKFDRGLGVATAAVDPNGLVTQWAHDGFGRITKEKRPDGTETLYAWSRTKDGGPQRDAWNVKLRTKTPGLEDDTVEFDMLGRAIRSWSQGVRADGAPLPARILREIAYDERGEHIARRLVPTSEATPESIRLYEQFEYDGAGRVVTHTTPWSGLSVYRYDGAKVMVWGPTGPPTIIENDRLGRPVSVTDPEGGVTEYVYGPFGGLWMVTDPGGAITLTMRDAYGRVRTHSDPDRGTTTAHYNGFGQRTSSIDALGRRIALYYDPLGRLVTREDADGTTSWQWDAAPHGIGQIASVTSPAGHQEAFAYDAFGRLQAASLTIDGETFATGRSYDTLGRLETITYPDAGGSPFAVRHRYDAHGHLQKVEDAATGSPYWTLSAADGAGRIRTETFGNQVVTARDYFEDKNRVQRIVTTSNTQTLQSLSYAYDDKLNLTSRSDALQVRTEYFAYDDLDRLICSNLDNLFYCHPRIDYAPDGNIEEKSDVGIYTYDPAHPHAVQTAGSAAFGYDAVGNQRSRPGATIEYTAFDLPKRFTLAQGGEIALEYDGNQQRIRKSTLDEVTVSVGELYERVTEIATGRVQHRFYVHSGERVIAVVTREEKEQDQIRYVHVDHLGSVDVLTDEKQTVRERRSYDATGARRNPAWGQKTPSPYAAETTRGYTGHEDDAELGLVNMRGRIYDPQVARFLTPDPVVAEPHFGQSYNRYAYVLNNPLAYVDPSGFAEVLANGDTRLDPPLFMDDGTRFYLIPDIAKEAQEQANRAAMQAGATTAPVDVGVTGNHAGYVPQPVFAATEQSSTIGKVGQTVLGIAEGLGEMALGVAKFAVLNALTLGGYGTYELGRAMWAGYNDDGVLGAINAVNPFYAIVAGTQGTVRAVQAGDYRAVGAAGVKVAVLGAAMVYGAGEGAGALAEEGAAGALAEEGAGAATGAATQTEGLINRINELRAAIPTNQKGRVTMAAGIAENAQGARSVLIATSEPRGYLRPGVTLSPGETLAIGLNHAEQNILNHAAQNGLRVLELGATRPICPQCASSMEAAGSKPITPLKAP